MSVLAYAQNRLIRSSVGGTLRVAREWDGTRSVPNTSKPARWPLLCAAVLFITLVDATAFGQAPVKPAEPAQKPAAQAEGQRPKSVKNERSAPAAQRQGKAVEAKKVVQASSPTKVDLVVADPKKDADFPFLGEYVGPVSVSPTGYLRCGLQIRPTGDGGFDAVQYRGGLPGEPGFQPKPVKLLGKRSDGFLVLSGGPWAVLVESEHCLLLDRSAKQVGRLERILRASPTLGSAAPKDATVLFDGKGTAQFTKGQMTPNGLLMEGAEMRPMLQDFNLHVEFMLPYMPAA